MSNINKDFGKMFSEFDINILKESNRIQRDECKQPKTIVVNYATWHQMRSREITIFKPSFGPNDPETYLGFEIEADANLKDDEFKLK